MSECVVSIIVCTHNRAALLERTLESLSRVESAEGVRAETIVVANACTDGTAGVVPRWSSKIAGGVRLVEEPVAGLSVARNRGVRESTGEIVAFLDDDVYVHGGWLRALAEVYRTTPAEVVAGRVELWWEEVARPKWLTPGIESILSAIDLGERVKELRTPEVIGANFSFRRVVFGVAGPFRTDLGRVRASLGAGEESVFVGRALGAGKRLFYAPDASVKHWVPAARVEMEYLLAASRSVARTIVATGDQRTLGLARTLALGLARVAGHGMIAAAAGIVGLGARRKASLVRRAIGMGQVAGVVERMRRGRSGKNA